MWAPNNEFSDPDTVQRPHTHTHRTKDHGITAPTLSNGKFWKLNVAEREMKPWMWSVSPLSLSAILFCLPPRFTSDGIRLTEDLNGKTCASRDLHLQWFSFFIWLVLDSAFAVLYYFVDLVSHAYSHPCRIRAGITCCKCVDTPLNTNPICSYLIYC